MLPKNVLIVGAGVGGITAALCLARLGLDVHVFEQAEELQSIGAGIQLTPNCTGVLRNLAIEDELREKAFLPEAISFRDWRTGRVLAKTIIEDTTVVGTAAPYYQILRSDLLDILVKAAKSFSNIQINLGSKVETVFQSKERVEITTNNTTKYGEFLIGADGIHSRIRSELWGDTKATFTKQVAWRALVPYKQVDLNLSSGFANVWWGPEKHFVHYLVGGNREQVNCVGVVNEANWDVESWEIRGSLTELKKDFCDWHEDLQLLMDKVEEGSLYKWALYDRPPLKQWGKGLVTLLGDAAHPMLPFMAQGAAMAIEDAAILSRSLRVGEDTPSSLRLYEDFRKKRTSLMQRGARHFEGVYHATGIKRWVRNQMAKRAGGVVMQRVFNYDPLTISIE